MYVIVIFFCDAVLISGGKQKPCLSDDDDEGDGDA
jgi:hypothetical protein